MNEQLKKRLIGATVLVLLAVIFVPMLFNSGEQTEMPTFGSNVPPKPGEPFQTIDVPLQAPAPQVVDNQPVTTARDAAVYEAQADQAPAVGIPPTAAPAEVAGAPATADVTSGPVTAPTPPSAPSAPKSAGPAAASATQAVVSGWAVQLGSFSKSANALTLRDQLRKKGYAAYVEHQKASGYRVRVGPELKRENADALKARLEKAGFKGVVMPHP